MENIVVADLTNPLHARAVIYLLNEYAKGETGGSRELPETVKQYELDPKVGKAMFWQERLTDK